MKNLTRKPQLFRFHSRGGNSPGKRLLQAFGVALFIGVHSIAQALGLGELEIQSYLNEPLKAQIPLHSLGAGELNNLSVTVADPQAFEQAGLSFNAFLNQLKFEVVNRRDGSPVVQITSNVPVKEPFLNFLLSIDWASGHMLREYTVLIDPPMVQEEQAVAVESPALEPEIVEETVIEESAPIEATVPGSAETPEAAAPIVAPLPQDEALDNASEESPVERETPAPVARTRPAEPRKFSYKVKKNDTLSEIALQLRNEYSVSLNQVMVALLRNNPQAFINNNVNEVMAGYELNLENPELISEIDAAEANAEVSQQVNEWLARKQERIERDVATREAQNVTSSASESQLKLVTPTADDDAPRGGLGAEQQGTSEVERLNRELALSLESFDASVQETEQLRSQLQTLEEQLEVVQKLMVLKDDQLSAIQGNIAKAKERLRESEQGDQPVVEEQPVAQAEEVASEGGLNSLLQRTEVQVGILVLLVLATIGLFVRQQKRRSQDQAARVIGVNPYEQDVDVAPVLKTSSSIVVEELEDKIPELRRPEPLFDAKPAPVVENRAKPAPVTHKPTIPVDVELTQTLHHGGASAAPAKPAERETSIEELLSIAGARIHAGRYLEARDALFQGLGRGKEDRRIKDKLVDVYYHLKDEENFEATAAELYDQGIDNARWNTIKAMGQQVCPDSPLFADDDIGFDVATLDEKAIKNLTLDNTFKTLAPVDEEETIVLNEASARKAREPARADNVITFEGVRAGREQLKNKGDDSVTETVRQSGLNVRDFDAAEQGGVPTITNQQGKASARGGESISKDLSELRQALSSHGDKGATMSTNDSSGSKKGKGGYSLDVSSEQEALMRDSGLYMDPDKLSEETVTLRAGSEAHDYAFGRGDIVGTKLDLARAYMDMGDTEGAQSILEEVVVEGNTVQKQQAQELMTKLENVSFR